MAQRRQQKDVITRLAETGEEALHRIADLPGGTKVVEAAAALREHVDDLTKRVRSLDPLEKRVAELERKLDELSRPARKTTTARKTATARKTTASRKKTT